MALPSIMRKLFRNDGYGPLLKPEIIPFASDLASNAADVATSTEWVKTLVEGRMYVDSVNGDDGNDGFSPETPKKTINSALETNCLNLSIAAGTYNENLVLRGPNAFSLTGNVTLNGYLMVTDFSSLFLYCQNDADYTLTINCDVSGKRSLTVNNGSKCGIYAKIVISTGSSANNSIRVSNNSYCEIGYSLSISHLSTNEDVIQCLVSSFLILSDDVNISGSAANVLRMWNFSDFVCYGNFYADSCTPSGCGININVNCSIYFGRSCEVKGSSFGLLLESNCTGVFVSDTFTTIKNIGSGIVAGVYRNSSLLFDVSSGKNIYLESYNNTSSICVECSVGSFVMFWGSGTYHFRGNYNKVIQSANNGIVNISASAVLTGTATGKRYDVWNNSQIYVDGKGVNRIPGSTAGTVKQNELSFYG